jgi:hypothetical protein
MSSEKWYRGASMNEILLGSQCQRCLEKTVKCKCHKDEVYCKEYADGHAAGYEDGFNAGISYLKKVGWKPIETSPSGMAMFVVIGVNVAVGGSVKYTTDPYCVWKKKDGTFARWPHDFQPTHWMPLPELPNVE